MAWPKKPGPPLLSMGSDEEGRKLKNSSSSEWTPKMVGILLDSYAQKFSVGRGYLRTKDWEEVVNNVNTRCEGLKSLKTMRQCRDKVDSLKRRYKMEKRKAVNGTAVTWPFFTKLDEMMGSVLKQGRGLEPLDRHQKFALIEYNHADEEEEKPECSGSPEECAVDSTRYDAPCREFVENGKPGAEDTDGSSEDGFQAHLYQQPTKLRSPVGAQEFTDNSSDRGKAPELPGVSAKVHAKKRKMEFNSPIHALADAVTGFSEVFARIELAKMEIFTRMNMEMAKLERKRRKRRRKHETTSSSSASSASSG